MAGNNWVQWKLGYWKGIGMGECQSGEWTCTCSAHCNWSWLLQYSWRAYGSGSWKVKGGKKLKIEDCVFEAWVL